MSSIAGSGPEPCKVNKGTRVPTASLLFRLRSSISRRLFDVGGSTTLRPGRAFKSLCEPFVVDAPRFVAENTTVPVPKVHGVCMYRGLLSIGMEFIKGEQLNIVWRSMSMDDKQNVISELADYIR